MCYEDGLAAQFEQGASLRLMALAQAGGFGDRLPAWLAPGRKGVDTRELERAFEALVSGDIGKIEADLRQAADDATDEPDGCARSPAQRVDSLLGALIDPLTLLGHGDTLSALHGNSLQRLGARPTSAITMDAALALAAAGDWTHAMQILDRARHASGDIGMDLYQESFLWKFAYLHRKVDSIMPALAEMPFRASNPTLAARRPWELKAYQIRAGMAVEVPVIEGEQPPGYAEAAAMQIAALDGDPAAAGYVGKLRRALQPHPIEMQHVDRGLVLSYDPVVMALARSPAYIAASRRDYAAAAAIARMPSRNVLIDHASNVIEAFIEEGDWAAAAKTAEEHDPREKEIAPGFDDYRAQSYVQLYQHLAIAAAWGGDDAAASDLLARAKTVHATEEPDYPYPGTWQELYPWYETMFAGAAEGRLPRKHLHVLMLLWAFPAVH